VGWSIVRNMLQFTFGWPDTKQLRVAITVENDLGSQSPEKSRRMALANFRRLDQLTAAIKAGSNLAIKKVAHDSWSCAAISQMSYSARRQMKSVRQLRKRLGRSVQVFADQAATPDREQAGIAPPSSKANSGEAFFREHQPISEVDDLSTRCPAPCSLCLAVL
jgi:hypothetical protein